jgi:hypothetical protein
VKKTIKYFFLILLGIFVLNLLSWFFIGKERILLTGADMEELAEWTGGIDTVYLFIGKVDVEHILQYSDYEYSTIEELVSRINSTGRLAIIDRRQLPLKVDGDDGEELINTPSSNAYSLNITVEHKFPLFAEVDKTIWAPGFGTGTEILYFWFFKWHYIVETGGFIT